MAYEVVKDIHGVEEAEMARKASEEIFTKGYSEEGMPEALVDYSDNMSILDLLVLSGIAPSKSEARRLVTGNGISINNEKETNVDRKFSKEEINNLIISKGKKTHIKVNLK